jgi:FecR protein
MKMQSPFAIGMAFSLSLLLVLPAEILAGPQTGQPRAGEVSRVIPAVNIERDKKKITASPKSVVAWNDVVDTQVNARARIALDDGSVLNVGSESSMTVLKHDAGAQQTRLELTYGKLRSQAQKIAKPDGSFEVRTPAGVAGVVGTDFFVGFDLATKAMNVLVFDGLVHVCNLLGQCVDVKAGQFTTVRQGDSSAPAAPTQAGLDNLMAASNDTQVGLGGAGGGAGLVAGGSQAHHISKGLLIGTIVVGVVPIAVVPIASKGSSSTTPTRPNCQTNPTGKGCG